MEIYKIISFVFVPLIFILALIFNKSLSLGLTKKFNVVFQIVSLLGLVWGFYSIISLFKWWSLLLIPIIWIFTLSVVSNFLTQRNSRSEASKGELLLEIQSTLGFFCFILIACSFTPYVLKWLEFI